jgi:phosphomannomutase
MSTPDSPLASALRAIAKAYDVRGTVPDQMNPEVAHALGVGFATFVAPQGATRVLVGRDMRPSGPELVDAFARGVMQQGLDVVDLGLASTDLVYYAAGTLDAPGAVFTASHNPAQYNGVKFCLSGARPVGQDTGLFEIRDTAIDVLDGRSPLPAASAGSLSHRTLLPAFADHVVSFVDTATWRPMRVVADTANGMGGLVVPAVFERIPQITLEVMYGELDGTFPNHPADPLQPENQRDLQARVVAGGFDVGLAFDGDADRVFVVDETGRGMSGSTTTALLAATVLRRHPGATILHNLICSRAVPEVVREHGGVPVRTKVGHSFIKQVMAETGAVFGGEHSAHYYFLDNFRADSGLIASMFVLDESSRAHTDLSVVRKPYERYSSSGEINTQVDDPASTIEQVAAAFGAVHGARLDRLDGLTVEFDEWWFNLRPSNTEPLLRLNLEAPDRDACDAHVADVLALVTST